MLCWTLWDWWATSRYIITTRDGSGATIFASGGESGRDFVRDSPDVIRLGEQNGLLRGLIRFDLSSLRGRRNIRDAVLQLHVVNPRPQAQTLQVLGLTDKHDSELWREDQQRWGGLPEHITTRQLFTPLGTIQVGREIAQTGGVLTLSSPELVEFLRQDTNDVVTFGLISPELVKEPIELASRRHAKLPPPTLRITLR